MALFKIFNNIGTQNGLPNVFNEGYCYFDARTNLFYIDIAGNGGTTGARVALNAYGAKRAEADMNGLQIDTNYFQLINGRKVLTHNTTSYWNTNRTYMPENGEVVIYDDYTSYIDADGNTQNIAGIKIGDGTTYIVDLPFVTDKLLYEMENHINNTTIHITQAEREFWNDKVTCFMDDNIDNLLVFTKE